MPGLNLLNHVTAYNGELTDRLTWLRIYLGARKNQDGSITLARAEAALVEAVMAGTQKLVLDAGGVPQLV